MTLEQVEFCQSQDWFVSAGATIPESHHGYRVEAVKYESNSYDESVLMERKRSFYCLNELLKWVS